jgi:hypothetical protein
VTGGFGLLRDWEYQAVSRGCDRLLNHFRLPPEMEGPGQCDAERVMVAGGQTPPPSLEEKGQNDKGEAMGGGAQEG